MVCVLDGISPPLMILIGHWHLVPQLRLLQVLLTATGAQVSYNNFVYFCRTISNNDNFSREYLNSPTH